MSKKKNKFKKNKKSNSQQILGANKKPLSQPIGNIDEQIDNEEIAEEIVETEEDPYQTDQYAHVKKDIRKILIIVTFIVIVLFAVYFVSLKTRGLEAIGDWIYKILNLTTG